MKKIFSIIIPALIAGLFASCTDLADIEQRVDELENRVTALETQVNTLNLNIETLQALAEGGIISSVSEKDGVYTITMGNGTILTLTQGSVGVANAPVMSIDSEGYWMVNYGSGAEYILVGGQKVKAVGSDGITPVFGVNADGYWTVSYDGGKTVEQVKGADGNPVKAIPDSGIQDKWFNSVEVKDGKIVVVTKDDKTYSLPIVADFLCSISNAEETVLFNAGE
ncbi:MAG: PL29 family lyase N-terminal domain-containing protein [Candidatus Cryptobacteroides sp.]